MIIRAKRKELFQGKPLTQKQQHNTDINLKEIETGAQILESYPRRLVFELTNACNLNCVMCGRNAADFKMTSFDMDVFRSFEPLMDIIEEVTLMGWANPQYIQILLKCLKLLTNTVPGNISVAMA